MKSQSTICKLFLNDKTADNEALLDNFLANLRQSILTAVSDGLTVCVEQKARLSPEYSYVDQDLRVVGNTLTVNVPATGEDFHDWFCHRRGIPQNRTIGFVGGIGARVQDEPHIVFQSGEC